MEFNCPLKTNNALDRQQFNHSVWSLDRQTDRQTDGWVGGQTLRQMANVILAAYHSQQVIRILVDSLKDEDLGKDVPFGGLHNE